MPLDQSTRSLQLTSALPDNELVITSFEGHEGLSQLFHFDLNLLSENPSIEPVDLIGTNATFSMQLPDSTRRYFNGFINRFFQDDEDAQGMRAYRAEIIPWFWFLTLRSNCRIFQGKTTLEIMEQIFAELEGDPSNHWIDYDSSHISRLLEPREYCVQYNETDFDFISRLLEEEGIFYFFAHEPPASVFPGQHKMFLCDSKASYFKCQSDRVDYQGAPGAGSANDNITHWEHRYEFHTGRWAQGDYNFQNPTANLTTNESTLIPVAGMSNYERYEYPGRYGTSSQGSALARIRMEAIEQNHDVVAGKGQLKTFAAGGSFTIGNHRSASENGKSYVLTHVLHSAVEQRLYTTGTPAGPEYTNEFECIPDSVTFRPPRITPKPRIQGSQTATVVGAEGLEIDTDKYGRVLVRFPWDREGKHSTRIRVAQFWAGNQWGAHHWPRIGHEVVVDFVNGDPDCPLIIGSVYNADNMPPYDLPANQTQSGIKSRSSLGGSSSDFNEIRFEDKAGSEEVLIHAQKDLTIEVENDETRTVERDQVTTVDRDRTTHVKGAFNETIDDGETRRIENGVHEIIASGGEVREVTDFMSETIHGALAQIISDGATIVSPPKYHIKTDDFQVINNNWFDTGMTRLTAYAVQSATAGVMNSNAGIQNSNAATRLNNTGVAMVNNGIENHFVGVRFSERLVEARAAGCLLDMVGVALINHAILIKNGTLDIEGSALKIFK